MALDVPNPPDLTNRGDSARFDPVNAISGGPEQRREELEEILHDGAWQQGFDEWAQYTDLTADDVERAEDIGLVGSLDFYWDDEADRLRYVAPEVPDDWTDRSDRSGTPASLVRTELDALGRTVAETIAADYVDWGDEAPSDLVWSVETFGQAPTGEGEEL